MMITDLSEDLVEEILSRVPATSLKRLRAACKQWNALFKDERFANKHFAKAAKQFEVLKLKENRVCSMTPNLHEILNNVVAAPSIEFKGGLKVSHNTSIHISHISHCDGLLLCTTNDYSIVVWNPCLGESRWIRPKTVYKEHTLFSLGYQNTRSSCRSYKILKCWFQCIRNQPVVTEIEIFVLSSGSWRVLDVVNPVCIIQWWTAVSLKGNTYWVAYKTRVFDHRVLLSFDFSTERFRRICLPFQDVLLDIVALSVVKEEKIVLLHQRFETLKLDIWVTANIDHTNALSWSKFLAVDLYTHNCCLSRFVTFFIEEAKKVAMCCIKRDNDNIVCIIGEDDRYREFTSDESMLRPFVFNYVPSLVQIPQG